MKFPSGVEAKFEGIVYTVVDAAVKPDSDDLFERDSAGLLLNLEVRMMNNSDDVEDFDDDALRLLVDGVPRAPDDFYEVVARRSAEDVTVKFPLSGTDSELALLVGESEPFVRLPIELED